MHMEGCHLPLRIPAVAGMLRLSGAISGNLHSPS